MRQTQNTQKKDNRKSIFVIALLLLLVAVIGFGGYTLSKYVTKKSAEGSASVAKWGYTVTTDASNLFGSNYKFGTNNSVVTDDTASLTVKSSDKNNRVAPGTTGSMTFEVKGNAEVKAQIAIELKATKDVVLNYTKTGVDGTQKYAPVKWTLKKDGSNTALVENKTLADIAKYFESNAKAVTVEPGVDADINGKYTIEWVWDFSTSDENDALDTLLGMVANSAETTENGDYKKAADTCTEIEFELNITITQLQK